MSRILLAAVLAIPLFGAAADFNGRWNIRVTNEPRSRVWWLEVSGAGTEQMKGRFVGAPGGGMDDIPEIGVRDGALWFAFDKRYPVGGQQSEQSRRGVYKARLENGKLRGSFELEGTAVRSEWIGERAPEITESDDGSWREEKSVELFNGKDLSNWKAMIPGRELGWTVRDGIMVNEAGANNLVSDAKFWNFRLVAEYRLGPKSNGGIGLRGRYEVQVYDDHGRPATKQGHGALYSRIVPTENASKPPGEWQTMDVRLVGRDVTVVLNGKKIIDRKKVEGLTAMANDASEADPGPITLQGDHGSVEIRKLRVTPLTRSR